MQQRLVGFDRGRQAARRVHRQADVLLSGLQLQRADHALEDVVDRHILHLQADADFDASQVEQVVHQPRHIFHAGDDLADVALLLVVQLAHHFEHGGIAAHQRQRRAQVMADRGDKFRLHRIQLFEMRHIPQDTDAADGTSLRDDGGGGGEVRPPAIEGDLRGLLLAGRGLQQVEQGFLQDQVFDGLSAAFGDIHTHHPGGRGVCQQEAVLRVNHQHRVGRGIEDRLQLSAAGLHVQEQVRVGGGQRGLPGDGRHEARVRFGERARLVVGGPHRAVVAIFVAQGHCQERSGLGQVRVQVERAGAAHVGKDEALLSLHLLQDLLVEMGILIASGAKGETRRQFDGVLRQDGGREHDAYRTGAAG